MVQVLMSDDQDKAWADLEAQAYRFLEHAKEVEPREVVRRYTSVLRLWHFPAFEAQVTWTILEPGKGRPKLPPDAPTLVREVTWDNQSDRRWMYDPGRELAKGIVRRPNIRLREALLPNDDFDNLIQTGANLAVPLIGMPRVLGLDGEFWGVETYAFSPNVRLQWFCAGPTEWRHFTTWVEELRAFLTRCLDQTG
jgi:hypothetical protein